MDFFSSQYKARLTVTNAVYSDVKSNIQTFLIAKLNMNFNPVDIVCLEPEGSVNTNEMIRKSGSGTCEECIFVMLTKVTRMDDYRVALSFVLTQDIPNPVINIINAIHQENILLRQACKREGMNADLIALGELN